MDHFAGLDVSVKETSICIVDDAGKIVRAVKVASEPEALLAVLKNPAYSKPRSGQGGEVLGREARLITEKDGPTFRNVSLREWLVSVCVDDLIE